MNRVVFKYRHTIKEVDNIRISLHCGIILNHGHSFSFFSRILLSGQPSRIYLLSMRIHIIYGFFFSNDQNVLYVRN